MKKQKLRHRLLSVVLSMVLLASLTPAAFASYPNQYQSRQCPVCHSDNCTWTVLTAATCHSEGLAEYVCTNPVCPSKTDIVRIPIDSNNHDATYSDNGDGTHSGVCKYLVSHTAAVNIEREAHTYDAAGVCTKCRAVNYGSVKVTLPENPEIYVSLNDAEASISLGDVSLAIGNADLTGEYTLSYNWYYEGKLVGSEQSYPLPASITEKEGSYKYVCFVMAVPKSGLTTQPISASCTVTVHVRDLITAYATVSTEDVYLSLGEPDSWSARSIEEQIYNAVYESSNDLPSYVVFGTKPVSKAGQLWVNTGANNKYYFYDNAKPANALSDVRFEVTKGTTGAYTISFTAYDVKGKSFPGMLTITVEQSAGHMDIVYATTKDASVSLDAKKFEDFWLDTYARGTLSLVRFTDLPTVAEGGLYLDFSSIARPGTRIKASDSFYVSPGANQYGISDLTFSPGVKQTGYVVIPFEASGINNTGRQTYLPGSLYIFVSDGAVQDVTCTVSAGSSQALDREAFLKVYQAASGSKGSGFYIQLLDVPASGSLYVGYTAPGRGTRLTASNIAARPFYYSSARSELIEDISYVPGSAVSESVRYVAYDLQGKMLFVGVLRFAVGSLSVSYSCNSDGVLFRPSDFAGLAGSYGRINSVSFTPPSASQGTLYYGRTSTSVGTAVTSGSVWYDITSSGSALTLDRVSFVPKAGFSGLVSIPFTAAGGNNTRFSGTVKINVTASTTVPANPTNPVNPSNPAKPSNPSTPTGPVKTFSDVKATDWFYQPVTELATANVIGGYPDGTFLPNGEVTYGEALKMILLAAGYPEQAPTGTHWASGYQTRAITDGIMSQSVPSLDRKITRYAIAEIAAKAMKLPGVTAVSPFTDMASNYSAAPYVMALYQIGVIQGTKLDTGAVNFYGPNSIRRSEMATIIWRMNNYQRTGNLNG